MVGDEKIKNNNRKNFPKSKDESNSANSFGVLSSKHPVLFSTIKEYENSNKLLNNKKRIFFKINNAITENKNKKNKNLNSKNGRWSKEEHYQFLDGIIQFGINWKKIKNLINTRTAVQVRSHAQKFYKKMKSLKDEKLGIDFTLNFIRNLKDMINHIKTVNKCYNAKNVFIYLDNKYEARRYKKSKNIQKRNEINNIFKKDNKIINLDENENNNINNNNPLITENGKKINNELKIIRENNNDLSNINNNNISLNNNFIIDNMLLNHSNLINNIYLQNQLNKYNLSNLLLNTFLPNNNLLIYYKYPLFINSAINTIQTNEINIPNLNFKFGNKFN